MEIKEPDAGKFFSVRKSICISPRHYAVTQIQSNHLTETLTIRPGKTVKKSINVAKYLLFGPNQVIIDPLPLSTADTEVKIIQVEQGSSR